MSENNEMAVIGRVAIVPKGEFDINASYKKLDMVLYTEDGNSYVAKKTVSGILPTDTEYWMKSTDMNKVNIATEQVAGIVKPDGDTITVDEDGTIHGATKVDTATSEKSGIVKPDNETIAISDGTITAIKAGFTGTKEEAEEAIQAGEIKEGEFVSITDDYEEGEVETANRAVADADGNVITETYATKGYVVNHPVKTYFDVRTEAELNGILNAIHEETPTLGVSESHITIIVTGLSVKSGDWYVREYKSNELYAIQQADIYDLKGIYSIKRSLLNGVWNDWQYVSAPADLENYGIVKLSNSSAVTENVGLALPASEKNASIEGTLANQIVKSDNRISIAGFLQSYTWYRCFHMGAYNAGGFWSECNGFLLMIKAAWTDNYPATYLFACVGDEIGWTIKKIVEHTSGFFPIRGIRIVKNGMDIYIDIHFNGNNYLQSAINIFDKYTPVESAGFTIIGETLPDGDTLLAEWSVNDSD